MLKTKMFTRLISLSLGLVILLLPQDGRAATSGNYTYWIENGRATLAFYEDQSVSGNLIIPDKLGGFPVSEIAGAFNGCAALNSVTIPDGVSVIGAQAFSGCTSLTNVVIPASVTTIGVDAFNACGLIQVTIPDSVTSIGDQAFLLCTALTNVVMGNGVESIGTWAFGCCSSLVDVMLPASLRVVGDCAFSDCTGLSTVFFTGAPPSFSDAGSVFSSTSTTLFYLREDAGWNTLSFADHVLTWWHASISSNPELGLSGGLFGFTVVGGTNMPLVVDACTNLVEKGWTTVARAKTDSAGSYVFTDPASTNKPTSFYRVTWPQ